MYSYTLTAIPECLSPGVSPGVYTARPISKLREELRWRVFTPRPSRSCEGLPARKDDKLGI